MLRAAPLLALALAAAGGVAAPLPPEVQGRQLYGDWLDPDKDCKLEVKGGKLRIALPATPHSLNPGTGKRNAPRVWRDVEGDFSAVVRVGFPIPPGGEPFAATNRHAVHAAGLIAWSGDDDHLRVVRQAHTSDKAPEEQFSWHPPHLGGRGEKIHTSIPLGDPTRPAYLRIERRGDRVTAGYSRNRSEWYEFKALTVGWKRKVKVGVVAENGYPAPFEATFEEYNLKLLKD